MPFRPPTQPSRFRLEDERDEIKSKPMDERTLSEWLRLVEIERELDPCSTPTLSSLGLAIEPRST